MDCDRFCWEWPFRGGHATTVPFVLIRHCLWINVACMAYLVENNVLPKCFLVCIALCFDYTKMCNQQLASDTINDDVFSFQGRNANQVHLGIQE